MPVTTCYNNGAGQGSGIFLCQVNMATPRPPGTMDAGCPAWPWHQATGPCANASKIASGVVLHPAARERELLIAAMTFIPFGSDFVILVSVLVRFLASRRCADLAL